MTNSKIFLFCLISFLFGIFFGSFFHIPKLIIYEFFLLGIFYLFFKKRAIFCFGLCLIILGFGILKGDMALQQTIEQKEGYLPFLKERLENVIDDNLSPPQSGLLSAILLGNKQDLNKEFKEKLNRAGIRHITAVSGLHIVVLSGILLWLGMIFLSRGQSFYFAVAFLWLFILMIGFQPSIIRAGIMGSLLLFCEKIGRQRIADRALFLTATVMLLFNPSLLRYSIGFQLSFLATLGIIYFMPTLQHFLSKFKLFKTLKVDGLLAMSFAAQIFTLPVLIYHFGQFSVVSPLTNLLVVPLLPYLMSLGFLFIFLGIIFLPIGLVFLFPLWLLLTYIKKVTEVFANLPFSALNFQLHWVYLIIIYAFFVFLIWKIKRKGFLRG